MYFLRQKIDLGEAFIEQHLPGNLKGLLPFSLNILTLSTLDVIEWESIKNRVHSQRQAIQHVMQQIETFRVNPETLESIRDLSRPWVKLSELSSTFEQEQTGILTDFANYICGFF